MTDTQLYVALGVPIVAILISLTLSLLQISAIRDDMRGLRADVRGEIGTLREDIREMRADIKLLTGKVIDIDNR
jgi:hypothetical protein